MADPIIAFPIATKVATKADVGLDNVDNTSDLNKPLSTAAIAANAAHVAAANPHTVYKLAVDVDAADAANAAALTAHAAAADPHPGYLTTAEGNAAYAAVGHTHPNATTSVAGFMSAADKTKLDALDEGGSGVAEIHIGSTMVGTPKVWIETGLGGGGTDWTIWFEDGT